MVKERGGRRASVIKGRIRKERRADSGSTAGRPDLDLLVEKNEDGP